MICTFNGEPIIEGQVHLPLNGPWTAKLAVQSDIVPVPGQTIALALGSTIYFGYVQSAGAFASRLNVRLVGGMKDTSEKLLPSHKHKTNVDSLVKELGYELDMPSGVSLPFWSRSEGTRGMAIQSLANRLSVPWRFLPDGRLRMRVEDNIQTQLTSFGGIELNRDAERGLVILGIEKGGILPGTVLGQDNIGDVFYDLSTNVRCRYYTNSKSPFRSSLESIVRFVTRDTLYLGSYLCSVVQQNLDNTLDLYPFDARIQAKGLQNIPIRYGVPGLVCKLPPGVLCMLSYGNGQPSDPYVAMFDSGGHASSYVYNVDRVEYGGTIPVALADYVDARFSDLAQKLDLHTHISAAPGSPTTTAGISTPSTTFSPIETVRSTKLFSK